MTEPLEETPPETTNPRREKPPLDAEQQITTAGVARDQSSQEQGHPGVGSTKIGDVKEREPTGEAKRLLISQHKEVQDLTNISDMTNARCQTSSDGPETQGTAPGSTNQPLSSNPQDVQGSRQRGQQLHKQEQEARLEASQGER